MPGGFFEDFFTEDDKSEESLQSESHSSEARPTEEVESQEDKEVLVEAASPNLDDEQKPVQESPAAPVNRIEALLDTDEEPEPTDQPSAENLEFADPDSVKELDSIDTVEESTSTNPAETTAEDDGDVFEDVEPLANDDLPAAEVAELDPKVLEKLNNTSKPFEQRWNSLISTTNWEKGAIIEQWREALIADDAPVTEYSDDTWAQRVGGVSGQHVGRLRRVFTRFGQAHAEFAGLYWSHFHATIDWDDAELWLEGAVQNRWSVSQMREQRWEATGADADQKPKEEDITHSVIDEDYLAPAIGRDGGRPYKESDSQSRSGPSGPVYDGPDFGDGSERTPAASSSSTGMDAVPREVEAEFAMATEDATPVQPFRDLADLPEDLAEAFDMFKLGILRHKSAQWEHVKLEAVLSNLDALKQLANAPSMDTGAPF